MGSTQRVAAKYVGKTAGRRSYFEVEGDLKAGGWRINKKWQAVLGGKDTDIYTKKFGGFVVMTVLDTSPWSRSLMLSSLSGGPRYGEPGYEEFSKVNRVRVEYDKVTPQRLDQEAKALVVQVKTFTKPRKRKTLDEFEWRREKGKDAYAKWLVRVEDIILEDLRTTKQRADSYRRDLGARGGDYTDPTVSTASIVSNVLNNHGEEPFGVSRRWAQKRIRGVLDVLARKGRILKDTNDPKELRWELKG